VSVQLRTAGCPGPQRSDGKSRLPTSPILSAYPTRCDWGPVAVRTAGSPGPQRHDLKPRVQTTPKLGPSPTPRDPTRGEIAVHPLALDHVNPGGTGLLPGAQKGRSGGSVRMRPPKKSLPIFCDPNHNPMLISVRRDEHFSHGGSRSMNTEWHLGFHDPGFWGWLATFGYGLATVLCFLAALRNRIRHPDSARIWASLALVLLLLGINKQLDLQEWMQFTGRRLAEEHGFYAKRRLLQTVFLVVFGTVTVGVCAYLIRKWQWFFRRHPCVTVGCLLLVLFVLLRAFGAEHVKSIFGLNIVRPRWRWGLELGGIGFLIAAALIVLRRPEPGKERGLRSDHQAA
jgi:hypothetical protein